MNSSYYIFPFNGNTMEILDNINTEKCLGIIDDHSRLRNYIDINIIRRNNAVFTPETKFIFAIGSISTINKRKQILESFKINDDNLYTYIDSTCRIGKLASIGLGSFLMGGAKVTSNAKLGKCVGILHNSVIHHDCKIGDFTLIGSNVTIAGNVSIGKNCFIGSGALIKPNITVDNESIIGMGAVVTKDVIKGSIVFGVPAKQKVNE